MLQRLLAARVGGVAILDGGMGTFLDTHGDVEPLNPFTELNESKFDHQKKSRCENLAFSTPLAGRYIA